MKWDKYNWKSKSNYVYSGLYAKHLNLYMTNRIIIYRHISIKVFDKIVNKTMITSTFWIDCFFTITLCINASTTRKITSSVVIFNNDYCKIIFTLITLRKLHHIASCNDKIWFINIFIHTIDIGHKSKYLKYPLTDTVTYCHLLEDILRRSWQLWNITFHQ